MIIPARFAVKNATAMLNHCVSLLGLPRQDTTDGAASTIETSFYHSSGGQESKVKEWARLVSSEPLSWAGRQGHRSYWVRARPPDLTLPESPL